ncbi:MAG: DUF5050 domain-containing protein [Oscillospiraceae bacterium]|nr:DUF5050 domain-containing protein [Oscillospiraceae bacterium]
MKVTKILALILALAMSLTLAACGDNSSEGLTPRERNPQNEQNNENPDNNDTTPDNGTETPSTNEVQGNGDNDLGNGGDASGSANIGDVIPFGGYDWRVLDVQDGRTLVISEYVLEARPYHEPGGDITWEDSTIRAYLNGEFLSSFSQADQARIIETTLINNNNPTYDTPGGNNTVDKIFLLSIDEARAYFADDLARRVYDSGGEALYWWLRSPGGISYAAAPVKADGGIEDRNGFGVKNEHGVRPAMWLNLSGNAVIPDSVPTTTTPPSTTASPTTQIPEEPVVLEPAVDPNERGNTNSNLSNGGNAAIKDDWIYYRSYDRSLYKINVDGTGETTLIERDGYSDWFCFGSINVVGDWIYYAGSMSIYKIRTDGTDLTQVVRASAGLGDVTVIGDWIYYKTFDGIFKVRTDGTEPQKLVEYSVDYLNVDGDWIYYRQRSNSATKKIRTDGTEETEIVIDSPQIFKMIVENGLLYVVSYGNATRGGGIVEIDGDGNELRLIPTNRPQTIVSPNTGTSDNPLTGGGIGIEFYIETFNIANDMIYYVRGGVLHRARLDGSDLTELAVLAGVTENVYFCIVGEWIYFTANAPQISAIRMDGTDLRVIG